MPVVRCSLLEDFVAPEIEKQNERNVRERDVILARAVGDREKRDIKEKIDFVRKIV
jgi:hypothetical protein